METLRAIAPPLGAWLLATAVVLVSADRAGFRPFRPESWIHWDATRSPPGDRRALGVLVVATAAFAVPLTVLPRPGRRSPTAPCVTVRAWRIAVGGTP